MIQIKKTILTLVALLAVTTGAWAQGFEFKQLTVPETWDGINGTINADDLSGFKSVSEDEAKAWTGAPANGKTFLIYKIDGEKQYYCMFKNGAYTSSNWIQWEYYDYYNNRNNYSYYYTAAPAFDVDWNKTTKTGSFTMPGGNVTLEPEYYPQATLTAQPTAINDVPATTDGAIVKAGTVKNIGETTTAQGTVMYYVSTTALDDAALLALAADAWTADVPTAQSLAQGQAYVYYYVRGNDGDTDETTYSDGDIKAANALTVTIAAEPTYAVTFADGIEESDKWTASPNAGVTKGDNVTVTYSGTKKVLGVKAEKKAAAPAATIVTGAVNANNLKEGDILKDVTSISGTGYFTLAENRYKENGTKQPYGAALEVGQIKTFSGYTITTTWNAVMTPIDDKGQDGNAWIVTGNDGNGPVVAGYTVTGE